MSVPDAATVRRVGQPVTVDDGGRVRIPRGAAYSAALLRISLGLVYLWSFVEQAFGVTYTNSRTSASGHTTYGWHFGYDSSAGWVSSGFKHSPTAGFVGTLHGPLAFIPKDLPTGVDDFGWLFAIGGIGIALTLGICMRIAGVGGFLLNILVWFSTFPPAGNPIIDGTHTVYALVFLLLMFLAAGNRLGLGRWWNKHTPAFLH
jgi:thiosulfate dehydrogenase [quinone] large subunit